jgi:hypothetical protein
MPIDYVRKLYKLLNSELSYNEQNKKEFHRVGKKVLKQIAEAMGLSKDNYDIRSNMGGIAVSGEVMLFSDSLHIYIQQGSFEDIMYRHVSNRKDYTGDTNCWMSCDYLVCKFNDAIAEFKRVADYGHRKD